MSIGTGCIMKYCRCRWWRRRRQICWRKFVDGNWCQSFIVFQFNMESLFRNSCKQCQPFHTWINAYQAASTLLSCRYKSSALLWLSGSHWSIFWPLAPKRLTTEKKVFGGNRPGATRITFRWQRHGTLVNDKPIEARVCMYLADPPTNSLCAHITFRKLFGWTRSKLRKKFGDEEKGAANPRSYLMHFLCALITQKCCDRFRTFKKQLKGHLDGLGSGCAQTWGGSH